MAQEPRQRYALQTIFSFFLGLMVAALVGVGVNTFYPSPQTTFEQEMTGINRQIEDLNNKSGGTPMSEADRAKLADLNARQRALQDRMDALMKDWARNTSIIVIIFATVVMALSLMRSEQLKVISNGLLLGGLFTMVYGTGWVIFSGDSIVRFFVLVFALVVSVGLGYLKFVRGRESGTGAPNPAAPSSAELGDLDARVSALETRLGAAASALSGEDERGLMRRAE